MKDPSYDTVAPSCSFWSPPGWAPSTFLLLTTGGELGARAGAAVVVSVLGAEQGAVVGEAARPSRRMAEVFVSSPIILYYKVPIARTAF